ncbi:alpha/beta fold hydrolase [Actinoplanes sp. NPDC051851]|uniref:alpha/beta fold hydrolase n=1 Tax=Actinoplanes sp. NPDC051851 TaxID=3154753 RepID=UPI0034141C1F
MPPGRTRPAPSRPEPTRPAPAPTVKARTDKARTGPARTGAGFHEWDADVIVLLDHLGLDRTALAGISGGGGYALAAAQRHPDRIDRLVLACAMVPGAPRSTLRRRKW